MTDQEKEELHKKIEGSVEARIISIEKRLLNKPSPLSLAGIYEQIGRNIIPILVCLAGGLGIYYGLVNKINNIETKIDIIQNNHLVHIQEIVTENKNKNIEQDKQITELCIKIERLLVRLGQ